MIFVFFIAQLHKNLNYYELLHVEDFTHRIIKRGAKPSYHPYNKIKEIEFKALGRNFRLILHPHKEMLHKNFRAYTMDSDGNQTIVHLDHDSFFRGRVFGETNSYVNAHVNEESGLITASIALPIDTYHIEVTLLHSQFII